MEKMDFYIRKWLRRWHPSVLTHLHTNNVRKTPWQDDLSLGGTPCDYPEQVVLFIKILICPHVLQEMAMGQLLIHLSILQEVAKK